MGALPRPDLPPGPHRDLVAAMHELHHRAGWPSLRVLAGRMGCSHTTVSNTFSAPRLPSWGVVELLVEAMNGDPEDVRALWLAASSPSPDGGAAAPFVGRTRERQVVRDRFASGRAGVLVVSGEAGIGKSVLVQVAGRDATPAAVLTGWCRPVSGDAPLMPVVDWLRAACRDDGGALLAGAVAAAPPYVAAVLARLVPELGSRFGSAALQPAGAAAEPASERAELGRLFAAVAHALTALAAARPVALVLEDAHWADAVTLELVEYLALRALGPPLVVTWRSQDPDTPAHALEWRSRLVRTAGVRTLELGPLSREQGREQLLLLGVRDAAAAESILARAQGNPLFAEQLAADGQHSPSDVLDDVIGRRIRDLPGPAGTVAAVLAVAGRSLSTRLLAAATGLAPADLAGAHRELAARLLLRPGDDGTDLRHPLVAEAVRRALSPTERTEVHRRLAGALAASRRPEAGEVAEHWRLADEPEREWPWRVRAARAAASRFALAEAADEWCRAIDLWPADPAAVVDGVRLLDAYLAAIDARIPVDLEAAVKLAADAVAAFPEVEGEDAALLYRRAAEPRGLAGDPEGAMALVDRAIEIRESGPATAELVHLLTLKDVLCWGLSRIDEGVAACARGLAISAELDDVALHRQMLAVQAQHDADGGRPQLACARLEQAERLHGAGPDPQVDVLVALLHSNVLLMCEAGPDPVIEAGRPGLEAAQAWGLDTKWVGILRANLADGLRRAGRVDEAVALIEPCTSGRPEPNRAAVHVERAALDLLRGRRRDATERMAEVVRLYEVDAVFRAYVTAQAASVDLWCGRPGVAHDRIAGLLGELSDDGSVDLSELLVLGARAAAELVRGTRAGPAARGDHLARLRAWAEAAAWAPFAPHPTIASRPARAATWEAELRGLAGDVAVDPWVVAAAAWDDIGRPFDAAYARLRAARVALATGRRTVGTGLLRHAHRQAPGHEPLRAAIASTATAR